MAGSTSSQAAAISVVASIGGAVSGVAMAAMKAAGDASLLDTSSMCPCKEIDVSGAKEQTGTLKGQQTLQVLDDVTVESGAMYYFTCKTRLLAPTPGDVMYADYEVKAYFTNASGRRRKSRVGRTKYIRSEDGWIQVGGDFTIKSGSTKLSIELIVKPATEYEVDPASLSLTRILPNPDWREQADKRIKMLRMGSISFKIKLSDKVDPKKVEFKLEQTRSGDFGWGAGTDAKRLSSKQEVDQKYRDFLFRYFTWAVPSNDIKWRLMESHEGQPNFGPGDTCLDVLEQAGLKVRGHCLMWGRDSKIPSWLRDKSASEVEENVHRRLSYTAKQWGSRFSHWDVNNENLHGAWYQEKIRQPDFLSRVFKYFNKQQSEPLLFINDFNVLASGVFTQAYLEQARMLREAEAPIGAIGVQSHFSSISDISLLTKRLSVLSEAGLPLWLTELTVKAEDMSERAQGYEDVLRLAYSHPSVHGVMLWAWWDGACSDPTTTLVEGQDFQLNEAGTRLISLLRHEWWTQETFRLPEGATPGQEVTTSTRAFHGTHQLKILYSGKVVKIQTLQLNPREDLVVKVEI